MKKIFKLLFTIILVLPIMVSAEVIDLELEFQKNYGVKLDGNQGSIEMFRYQDFYIGFYDNSGGGVSHNTFFAIDKYGNKKYSSIDNDLLLYTGDRLFIISRNAERQEDKSYINTFYIEEVNLQTGEQKKAYSFVDTYTTGYSYVNNLYYNDKGIVIDTNDPNIYCISSSLDSHSIVDDTYFYDDYELPKHTDRLNDTEYNKFMKYLFDNLSLSPYDLVIDYAVEYENNYFTVIANEGGIVSLVYTTKDLIHDIHNYNLNNEELNGLGINEVEIFAEKEGLNVFFQAGYRACPRSNTINIPTKCYANGDIVLQQYTPIYDIEKKTDGNGTIEAIEKSKSGETIKYKVTPKEGYKVEKITIIDANGRSIEIKDNEFIMPSADVIIEASFIVDNPNTSSNIYLGIAIIILVVGAFIIKKNKAKIDFIDK